MANHPLNVPFKASGEWFLPEDPARLISGTLDYTPRYAEVTLHETLRPFAGDMRAADSPAYPVVYGVTITGERVTLYNAQRMGLSVHYGNDSIRSSERVISPRMVVGAHLAADFAYPEMRCQIPGLEVWLSKHVVESSQEKDPATGAVQLSFRVLGLPEEVTPAPAINGTLGWSIGRQWSDSALSVTVTTSGWVRIRPDVPQPLEWFLEQLAKLTPLLTFLAGAPMTTDCIEASIDEQARASIVVVQREPKCCSYTSLHEFFMPRKAMGVELAKVVARWFEIYPKVASPSQLALSILASEDLWPHVEFLSLMQALEGFHRSLFPGSYMDEKDYEAVKKILGDAIPNMLGDDHKDALRSKIKYGNQIALRKRLNELATHLTQPIKAMIFGNSEKLIQRWIDTRNYYTHWDESLRQSALEGQRLYYANVRLRAFLRVLYLDLTGIPMEAIAKALTSFSDVSQHLAQLNAIEHSQ